MKPTEAIAPTGSPQSTCSKCKRYSLFKSSLLGAIVTIFATMLSSWDTAI